MQPYRNLSGCSGVVAFELHPKSVIVQFQDGCKYEYTAKSAGIFAIAKMKKLALSGRGLSSYIAMRVRDGYERKFH